ncbi:hypothetical protein KY289_011094 [Solanum tuberosum]|nr:hypothetical protein KY289_011094 [Solanum tuberosum]
MQLVQSVLFGIQAYWAQLFIIPSKVIKLIDAHCRSYGWSGTKALVAWERVCSPKSVGGLNLINLHSWNKAAIAKHCWDLEHKQEKLWIKWVHSYYIKRTPFQEVIISQQACWMVSLQSTGLSKLLQWIQFVQAPYNNWSQYVLGIIDAAKGKTPIAQIFKLVSTEYVYAIWIERNHIIFEKDSRTWESLAKEIAYICCVRASQKTMQAIHQFAF